MTTTFQDHCESLYNALDERAINKKVNGNKTERVFTGAIVPIFKSLGISQAYYGPIFKTLEDVGSILKIQRGARGIDTVIVLRGLPEVWPEGLGWRGRNSNPLTEDSRYAKILLDVQDLKDSIGGINVLAALAEIEQRLLSLERKALDPKEGTTSAKSKKSTNTNTNTNTGE